MWSGQWDINNESVFVQNHDVTYCFFLLYPELFVFSFKGAAGEEKKMGSRNKHVHSDVKNFSTSNNILFLDPRTEW